LAGFQISRSIWVEMDEKNKSRVYTIAIEYLYQLLEESDKQINVSEDMLQDMFANPPKNSNLLSSVVEILWLNYTIVKVLDEEIDTAVIRKNDSTGEDEFMLAETTMWHLEQLLLARWQANLSLTKLSYSVSLH